jgi:EF hand
MPMKISIGLAVSMVLAGCAGTSPPSMQGDPAKNPDMSEFAKSVDADGNGQLSRAEWQAQGLPASSFNMFEKGRGFVTLHDYQINAAPAGIDINGDGKLTIAEFKEFDQKMAADMAKGGAPPR